MTLYRNIIYLFVWQGSTYIVPLIITPYLARVLGLNAFGTFGLSLAVLAYAVLLADWGFSLSATQKVARAADNPEELRRLFWSTMLAKGILAVFALALLGVSVLFIPALGPIWFPVLTGSLTVIAAAFNTSWFLQGLQFMGSFAAAALIGRFLTIPLTLLLVHQAEDVWIATAVHGGTQLISAIISLIVSCRIAKITPITLDPQMAFREIQSGWHQFIANLSISMYTQINSVIVGLLAGTAQAGLLIGSQRIAQAFQGLVTPINLAIYPHVSRLTETDPAAAVRVMFYVLAAQTVFAACLSIAMYLLAPYIVPLFLGEDFQSAISVVQTLAFIPILMGITNVLGQTFLLPLGFKAAYTLILSAAGILNIIILLLTSTRLGAIGGALAAVFTEAAIILMMVGVIYLKRSVLLRMRLGKKI